MRKAFDPQPLRQLVSQYLLSSEPDRSEAFTRLTKMGLKFSRGLHLYPDTVIVGDEVRWQQSTEYDAVSMALLTELAPWYGRDEQHIIRAVNDGEFDFLLRRIRQAVLDEIKHSQRKPSSLDSPNLERWSVDRSPGRRCPALGDYDEDRNWSVHHVMEEMEHGEDVEHHDGAEATTPDPVGTRVSLSWNHKRYVDNQESRAHEVYKFLEEAAAWVHHHDDDAYWILMDLAETFRRKHKRIMARRERKLATTRSVREKLKNLAPVSSFVNMDLPIITMDMNQLV